MDDAIFIKGHINFRCDEHDLEYLRQNISVFGVAGLPSGIINIRENLGRSVNVTVRIPTAESPLLFRCEAQLMREYTAVSEHCALRFQLDDTQRRLLTAQIQRYGFHPTDHIRKYPRIPANETIQTFPLHVFVSSESMRRQGGSPEDTLTIFKVENLSPSGILLSTENQSALAIRPGERLNLVLDPRGWFPLPIKAQGLVCRAIDSVHPKSGNLFRLLGIRFVKMDATNRAAFLDLLRDIVNQVRKASEPAASSEDPGRQQTG